MAATIDATIKGASANSYVTLSESNDYFDTSPDSSTWTNKTDDQKKEILNISYKMDRYFGLSRR